MSPRRRKAADDQLLLSVHLSFSQSRERVGHVRRTEPLGDQPFPAVATASASSDAPSPVTCSVMRNGSFRLNTPRALAPLLQRERPQVAAAREQHVEDVVEELAVLTAAEPVATADEGDHLAVDHEAVRRVRVERGGQRLRSDRSAIARCASTAGYARRP